MRARVGGEGGLIGRVAEAFARLEILTDLLPKCMEAGVLGVAHVVVVEGLVRCGHDLRRWCEVRLADREGEHLLALSAQRGGLVGDGHCLREG